MQDYTWVYILFSLETCRRNLSPGHTKNYSIEEIYDHLLGYGPFDM